MATRNPQPQAKRSNNPSFDFLWEPLVHSGLGGCVLVAGPHRAFPLAGYHWARVRSWWLGSARLGTAVFPLQPVTSSVGWSHHNKGRGPSSLTFGMPYVSLDSCFTVLYWHLFFQIYTLVGIIITWLILSTFIKTVSNLRKYWRWSDLSHKIVYYWKGTKQLEPNTKLQQLHYITITSREFKKWQL